MNQVDDHWMRPRTKAGTEEMRKRLNAMRGLLKSAAAQSIESQIASKVFDEYFSFEWEDTLSLNVPEEEVDSEKKKVALPDRC
tara:strand:+ start:163 stop:411 length:249 start_codon:yes stop_codon:yes gene_type:complete